MHFSLSKIRHFSWVTVVAWVIILLPRHTFGQTIAQLAQPELPTPVNVIVNDPDDGTPYIQGYATRDALNQNPFCDWFGYQYNAYTPDFAGLNPEAMKQALKNTDVVVFMGTWCGDSQREVPRLFKVLDALGVPETRVKIICLDGTKQDPLAYQSQQHIHHVPAIIFAKDGKELARITESPQLSMEVDMAQIIAAQPYAPKYVFSELLAPYVDAGPEALAQALPKIIQQHRTKIRSVYEINSYAGVLMYAGKNELALQLYNLNTQLFPNEPVVYERLANFLEKQGQKDKAIDCLRQGLKLVADRNERLQKRLLELAGK